MHVTARKKVTLNEPVFRLVLVWFGLVWFEMHDFKTHGCARLGFSTAASFRSAPPYKNSSTLNEISRGKGVSFFSPKSHGFKVIIRY